MRVEVIQPENWDNFGDYTISNDNVAMSFPVLIPEDGLVINVEHTGKNNQEGSIWARISDEPYGQPLLYPNPAYNTFSLTRFRREIKITRTHIDNYEWQVPANNLIYIGFFNAENKVNFFSFFVDETNPTDCLCK